MPKSRRRDVKMSFMVRRDELDEIHALASGLDMSGGEFMRWLVDRYKKRR